MSDELKSCEGFAKGLRRIARGQVGRVLKRLAQKPPQRDGGAIHEARKDLKKLRAALRLAREGIGRRLCREENRRLREAGRALAPMRDAEALVKTLEQLRCCCHGKMGRAAFARLRAALLRRRQGVSQDTSRSLRESKAVLRAARRRIKHWPLGRFGWKELCRGIRRTYKQGAKAFRRVEMAALPESLHEWRKRAKDLWHQLRILKPLHPQPLGALSAEMKRLSEYLGDAHDLALLETTAAKTALKSEEQEMLGRLIQVRRGKLQRAALELGRRLYAQKPGVFVRPIKHQAKAWLRRHKLRLRNQAANDD